MHRRAFLASVAAGGTTSLAGCSDVFGSSGGVGDPPPRLSVDGRWLVDPTGSHVVPRGVNVVDPWWGTEYDTLHGKSYWDTLRLATSAEDGWHARVLRVPLQPRTVENVGMDRVVEEYLDRVVEITRRQSAYVILDYHAIERYNTRDIDRRVRRFWRRVASRYADEPHVIFELFNEPTEPAADSIATWRTWRETAQPWVDLVKDRAPDTPLIVGSPRWSSLTAYAPEAPFEGDDLLYTAHIFPSWSESNWEGAFGAPAREVPVVITEWGYVDVENDEWDPYMLGSTPDWGKPFREWVESHENMGWCAWCFSSEWAPPMFDEDWNLLGGEDYMGEFTRTWLAERRDDHQPGTDTPEGEGGTASPVGNREPPAPPTDLTVEDVGPTGIRLSWTAGDDADVATYRVTTNDAVARTVDGTETEAIVRGLETATSYEVRIAAVDGDGLSSSPSESVAVTTADPTAVTATLPRTATAPTVDGRAGDAWSIADPRPLAWPLVGDPSPSDLAAEWRGCWDDDALYVHVAVTDGEASVDSDDPWQDDSVELYLDVDHSRGSEYDGDNDSQFFVVRGTSTLVADNNSVPVPEGARAEQRETDDGWAVEVAVPWEPMGASPTAGDRIGLDVHVNDDDDGEGRTAKLAWYATTDDSWEDPRLFPTVELGE